MNSKVLSMLGLSRRAGAVIIGTDLVTKSLPSGKVKLVMYSCDSSANTEKKITDKCSFYGVKCIKLKLSSSEIGDIIGKSGAVCTLGITDKKFAGELIRLHLTINEETR